MIIDFHVHCFPDDLATRALTVLEENSGIAPSVDGTIAGLKKSMSQAGIDLSVVQSIATKPSQTVPVNSWAARIQQPAIASFGSIHPAFEEPAAEIRRIKELGLKGVKFHPDYQDFYVDEDRLLPLYEALAAAGLIILFHAGLDIGMPEPCHCTPERLARVLDRVPGATVVAAHMGGFRYWEEVEKHLIGRDLFLDTSYSLGHMPVEQFRRLIDKHGWDKILFATDSPWADQRAEKLQFESLELSPEISRAILGGNAESLLDSLPAR